MTVSKHVLIVIIALISNVLSAQHQHYIKNQVVILEKRTIWGGIGLGFGTGYTNTLAPSAIYNFNEYVVLGLGAQYT
jgi:hypothetical protein